MVKYDLGIIRADDLEIMCSNYKVNMKQTSEKIDITSSYDSIGWKHGKRSYTIDCSEVYPEQLPAIKELFLSKKEFPLALYNILEDGTYKEEMVLLGCIITELDVEMDSGEKSSFKAEALKLQE